MNKYVEDGHVAVIISPGFGAGWTTWNNHNMNLVFDPILVELVKLLHKENTESEKLDIIKRIEARAEELEPDGYFGSASELGIVWLPEGTRFIIEEYDGSESIRTIEDTNWITA